jgi:hypothetical protein
MRGNHNVKIEIEIWKFGFHIQVNKFSYSFISRQKKN